MSPKYRFIPIGGGGGDTPTGTINITNNGTFDVAQYASASVNVPASAVDSGTLTIEPITSNVTLFTQDVTGYRAIAFQVAVPASAVDSGTKQITTNGNNQDVVGYAAVDVNVPAPYWEGTQAQYDALAPDYDPNTLYLITA